MTAPQDERWPTPAQVGTLPGVQTNDATGDLMRGSEGRTARLTFISVLLGAMVGAIVAALPPTPSTFATTVLAADHLLVDLQVLVMLLIVFNIWIAFSWSVILGLTPFDFLGNLQLFLTAVAVLGWALSVSDYRAWLGWYVAVAASGCANLATSRFIRGVRIPWWRVALYAAILLAAAYVACDAYGVFPASAVSPVPPLLWVAVVLAEVVVDLGGFTVFLHAHGARLARPSR
jgi:hypothetical protein